MDKPHRLAKALMQPVPQLTRTMLSKYGITAQVWLELFSSQNGQCAICSQRGKLVVDHCHDTGRVRGLLCKACNSGLGMFRDNAEAMRLAAAYLDAPADHRPKKESMWDRVPLLKQDQRRRLRHLRYK